MVITVNWKSIITAGAVVGALVTIITLLVKLVRWVDKQKQQDTELAELRVRHEKDMEALKDAQKEQMTQLQHELTLICYGLRGALQGLIENGCNGPCKEALTKLDKHLNQAAHDEVKA